MIKLDLRGMACPIPVVETRKQILSSENRDILIVSVDNRIATENLSKLAKKMDFNAEVKAISDNHYEVMFNPNTEKKQEETVCDNENKNKPVSENSVAFICTDKFGSGDDELGQALMKSFLYALTEVDSPPNIIIFCNAGVKLVVESSDVLESLKSLEQKGIEILCCGACLDFYNLKDKLAVGSVSNMYTIADILCTATRIIKP